MGYLIHQVCYVAVPALRLIAKILGLEVLEREVIDSLFPHSLLPLLGDFRPYAALVGVHEGFNLDISFIRFIQEELDVRTNLLHLLVLAGLACEEPRYLFEEVIKGLPGAYYYANQKRCED